MWESKDKDEKSYHSPVSANVKRAREGNHINGSEGIDPNVFYGAKKYCPTFHTSNLNLILPTQHLLKFTKLLGPSTIWKIFKKQDELIDHVSQSNCDLLPFTFQSENGNRLFLAAHPKTFWYYDGQRNMKDRHSYEIIREFQNCKLYFDLEFDTTLNSNHNGHRMVSTFINLVCSALRHRYNAVCDVSDVLNLDSSTDTKFSCHLIFQPKIQLFCDNYNVGFFVKQLCHEIRLWIRENGENENLLLLPSLNSSQDITELEVIDSKGNKKLFCDEGVYTKNRHFRLYKSSKFGKNVPLVLSMNNKFEIPHENETVKEETLFLCSLITWSTNKHDHLLEFPPNDLHYPLKIRNRISNCPDAQVESYKQSPFPDIDKCISNIVNPGKIWRSVFFKENCTIVYDIVGNRFCLNIGRAHKSNNVKYVVDLHTLTYYQKCYDPDCADFKSPKKSLPINEQFFLNNDIDDNLFAMDEEQLQMLIGGSTTERTHLQKLFSSDMIDEEFNEIAEQWELHQQRTSENVFFGDTYEEEMIAIANRYEEINNSLTS